MKRTFKKFFVYFLTLSLVLPNFSIPSYASELSENVEIQILNQEKENNNESTVATVSENDIEYNASSEILEEYTEETLYNYEEENVVCKHGQCNNPAESSSAPCDACKEAFYNEEFYEYVNKEGHYFSVTCTCGDVFSGTEPHWEYQNGLCLCGYELNTSGDASVNFTYEVLNDGTLSITGCTDDTLTSLIIPNEIDEKVITNIAPYAFSGCSALSNIVLPNTLTDIGEWAFSYCSSLVEITLPDTLTTLGDSAFSGCTSLTAISIPNNISSIGEGLFFGCSKLQTVVLPDNLISIESSAFYECYSLETLTLPNNIRRISSYAFYYCNNLSSIKLPYALTIIGNSAFAECTGLTAIDLPENLTAIGEYAFQNCTGLTKIKIPSYVTEIKDYTFCGCSGLTDIELPEGLSTIESNAFSSCTNLKNITLLENITCIENNVFDYVHEDFTIYGIPGSYAETYANEHNIPFAEAVFTMPYTIAFNKNNASATGTMAEQIITKDSVKKLNAYAYVCSGYTFKSWNTKADGSGTALVNQADLSGLETQKGDVITLYAQWEKVNYSITYYLNSGKNHNGNPKTYNVTTNVTLKNPTRTGYTFGGWYSDSKFSKKITGIPAGSIGNKKLYAKWISVKYTIRYTLNGGKNNSKNPTSYNVATATIKLQNPTRTGYTFKGWYSDSKFTKKVTSIAKGSTQNKVLYAKWEPIKYTIKYNLNGGKNHNKNPKNFTAATAAIKLQNPTRAGYTFKGWYTSNKFTKKVTTIKNGSIGTQTLYAKWEPVKYTIKYNLNGGKNHNKNPKTYTTATATVKLQNPTRAGYTFKGWYSDKKCTKKITAIKKGSMGTQTLYAKWVKK